MEPSDDSLAGNLAYRGLVRIAAQYHGVVASGLGRCHTNARASTPERGDS